jgi:hypothetical protein
MRAPAKIGLVAVGYVVAFLIASAAVAVRMAATSGPVEQASSGMYAFGDGLLFLAVFAVASVPATAAALVFLRPYRLFWTVISLLAVIVAATGIAAAILFAVGRAAMSPPLPTWASLSVLRILVAPVLALTFLVCTVFSPTRFPRLAFLAAALMEVAVSAYWGVVWLLPVLSHHP